MRNTSQDSGWWLAPDGSRYWYEPHPNPQPLGLDFNATTASSKPTAW